MISFTVDKAGRLLVVIPDHKGKLREYLPVPRDNGFDLCHVGNSVVRTVYLVNGHWRCSCEDFVCRNKQWSDEDCKHTRAAKTLTALYEAAQAAGVA